MAAEHGSRAVAVAGSTRCSLETMAELSRACRGQGWRGPVFFEETRHARAVGTAVNRLLTGPTVGLPAIEAADLVIVAGVDPVHEAPMLALALRQARRRGAKIVIVDPRPVALPFDFEHLPLPPGAIGPWLERLGGTAPADDNKDQDDPGRRFRESDHPVIVAGTDILPAAALVQAADLAAGRVAAGQKAGLFCILPGPNAFGAALLDEDRNGLEQVIADIEGGAVKALVLVESDAAWRYPDQARLANALAQLDLLIVLDYLASPVVEAAHVFLPTTTVYESGGVFISNEGRVQQAPTAMHGGTPSPRPGRGAIRPGSSNRGSPALGSRRPGRLSARWLRRPDKPSPGNAPPLGDLDNLHPALAAIIPVPLQPRG